MTCVTGSDLVFNAASAEIQLVVAPSADCLAIDIGGSKLAVALVDSSGKIVDRAARPTPSATNADDLFSLLLDMINSIRGSAAAEPGIVGVGCGGPMEPGGRRVSPLNIPAWRSFPLYSKLVEATGLEVVIDNDAKALALAEGWRGAATDVSNYLAMVVSTGVGGGIVVDGHLLDGRLGNAGHIGHLVVEPDGRRCRCGVNGCLEAEASGSAIEAFTGSPAKFATADIVERTGTMVGRAVASVVTLLDLDLCVIAGSVALGFGRPFFKAANEALIERVGLDYTLQASIVPAGLGADGPLIGAAKVALDSQSLRMMRG